MTQYREILRLHSMNLSQMNIAVSCGAFKEDREQGLESCK